MQRIRFHCASKLGLNLDRIAARQAPDDWVYHDGLEPWSFVRTARYEFRHAPCPVCHDAPLSPSHYCAGCDRSGLDGRVTFPGLPVDAAPRTDYRPGDGQDGRRLVAAMRPGMTCLPVGPHVTRRVRRALRARLRA